jgi:hypothetical protein
MSERAKTRMTLSSTAEYANFIKQDYLRYGSVVRDLGIQIE